MHKKKKGAQIVCQLDENQQRYKSNFKRKNSSDSFIFGRPYTPVTRGVEGYTGLVDMNLFLDRISGLIVRMLDFDISMSIAA